MTVTHCFREYFAESLKTALKPKYVCCNILAFIALLTTQSHSRWPHGNLWYPGKKVLPEQLGGGCWRLLVSSRLPQWLHCCGAGCQLEMLNAEPPQLTAGSHSTPAASNFSRWTGLLPVAVTASESPAWLLRLLKFVTIHYLSISAVQYVSALLWAGCSYYLD